MDLRAPAALVVVQVLLAWLGAASRSSAACTR